MIYRPMGDISGVVYILPATEKRYLFSHLPDIYSILTNLSGHYLTSPVGVTRNNANRLLTLTLTPTLVRQPDSRIAH